MSQLKIDLVFNYNNRLNKKGQGKVDLRIYFKGRKLVSTGVSVKPEQWDNDKKRVQSHPKKDIYNRSMKTLIRLYEENEEKLFALGRPYDLNDILTFHELSSVPKISFSEFVTKDFISRTDLKPGTLKNHKSFLKRLSEFSANVEFKDLT